MRQHLRCLLKWAAMSQDKCHIRIIQTQWFKNSCLTTFINTRMKQHGDIEFPCHINGLLSQFAIAAPFTMGKPMHLHTLPLHLWAKHKAQSPCAHHAWREPQHWVNLWSAQSYEFTHLAHHEFVVFGARRGARHNYFVNASLSDSSPHLGRLMVAVAEPTYMYMIINQTKVLFFL